MTKNPVIFISFTGVTVGGKKKKKKKNSPKDAHEVSHGSCEYTSYMTVEN
jgi:hypothetical protein